MEWDEPVYTFINMHIYFFDALYHLGVYFTFKGERLSGTLRVLHD